MNSPTGSKSPVAAGPGVADRWDYISKGAAKVRSGIPPKRPLRVLLGRLGNAEITLPTGMAHAFRQAGMEVVVAGAGLTPEVVCAAAIQEDVDVIAISALDDQNTALLQRLAQLLHLAGANDKLMLAGTPLAEQERENLLRAGYQKVFPIGADLRDVVQCLEDWRDNRIHLRLDG